jgi:hypothetical protein
MAEIVDQPAIRTSHQARFNDMMERGQERTKQKMTFHIGRYKINLENRVARVAEFVLWGKALADEAVKVSREASLVWAGVCLILPLLTYPQLAEEARKSGFDYVTARMEFYLSLEPRLFPKDRLAAGIPEELCVALQKDVLDLYELIHAFQFESVLHLHQSRWRAIRHDLRDIKRWDESLSKVKVAENILERDLRKISDVLLREQLETLDKGTRELSETMRMLLTVTERTLQTNERQAHIQEDLLQSSRLTKYVLGGFFFSFPPFFFFVFSPALAIFSQLWLQLTP